MSLMTIGQLKRSLNDCLVPFHLAGKKVTQKTLKLNLSLSPSPKSGSFRGLNPQNLY